MIMASQYENMTPSIDHERSSVQLRCPRCGEWIGHLPDSATPADMTLVCSGCGLRLSKEQGIWKCLLPERAEHFSRFMTDYQFIREAEGRGSNSAEYYLALPYRDLSGNNSQQWTIRARTFRYINRHILPGISTRHQKKLRILDLGAGNGWMSYCLALQGHSPTAVDLLTNDRDGLGAAIHYKKHLTTLFPRFQAELDTLPFPDDEFDLIIYNASFHYSENYEKTLAEALRCVRADGTILIADSPWYANDYNGQQMLSERREAFTQRYGFPSDSLKSLEYLTDQRLQRMEESFGIRWQTHTPNYGIRWQMRPMLAKLHGNREPSLFRIYTAKAKK
jgi:SAM-dependent methyltransferase